MTYKIYADLALIWAFTINMIVMFITDRLLGARTKIYRLIPYAFMTALLCTFEYIIFYRENIFLQDTLYVITYLIILYVYHKSKKIHAAYAVTLSVCLVSSIIVGTLLAIFEYSLNKGLIQTIIFVLILLFALPAVWLTYMYGSSIKQIGSNTFDISISVKAVNHITKAYYDTGNVLHDMCGRPVVICSCAYADKILGSAYRDIIASYKAATGFDYRSANLISGIYFQPIPYKTISSRFSILPGFMADSLTYLKSCRTYRDIVIAIAPNDMTLGRDINILLNDSIKP